MQQKINCEQWRVYDERGYVKLGRIVDDRELGALRQRINDIMLGLANIDYDRTLMQVDSEDGAYDKIGAQTKGYKGPHLNYRKIEQLECDPLYLRYMQRSIFRDACARIYGSDTTVAVVRAMFMNKPAGRGTWLPWHQDVWVHFDHPPQLTVWMALDAVTRVNGCMQIIPGSHKRGHINPNNNSGFLTKTLAEEHCPAKDVLYVEVDAGEVVLLNNFLLHASDVNHSSEPRRAFSFCVMEAGTKDERGIRYATLFGDDATTPEQLEADLG